jgi:hypothetical protein
VIYVVFQEAVYRHGCGGVFTTREAAVACAIDLAVNDIDNHHDYHVVPFVLDARTALTEEPSVFIVNKTDGITLDQGEV